MNDDPETKPARQQPDALDRRDFLKRVGAASVLAVASASAGLWLYDAQGPHAAPPSNVLTTLGDFSIPGHPSAMAVARGTDRAILFDKAMAALGGLERFVAKGDRVLVKVNAAFATPASLGATSNPELVGAVVERCKKAGAERVFVTDNPINSPEACFEISGIGPATRRAGGNVLAPAAGLFSPLSLTNGKLLRDWPVLAGAFRGVTKLIVVSPVKDHHRAGASMTLKNLYGFLGGKRNVFHQDINTIVTELSLMVRPTLSVLDGVNVMMTNGPTGGSLSDLKAENVLAVSTDPVAADAFGLTLLGRSLADVPYVLMAQQAGAGNADLKAVNPVFLDAGT
ncbi:hypothetical protein JCM15519_36090 [Fundidesulfovibrio butyratiphilus]